MKQRIITECFLTPAATKSLSSTHSVPVYNRHGEQLGTAALLSINYLSTVKTVQGDRQHIRATFNGRLDALPKEPYCTYSWCANFNGEQLNSIVEVA